MMTMRELVSNRYGKMEFFRKKNRDWTSAKFVSYVREMTCDLINKHYRLNGFDKRVTHESYATLGIDLIPSVHKGPATHIKASELEQVNFEIAAFNAQKIQEKPSIILDLLGMNYPVFTKEQIASELEKRLHAGIDFSQVTNIEELNNELSKTFTLLYDSILNCPEISQVVEEDLKGRALYTTTKRLELEQRFEESVNALKENNSHALNLEESALDHLSLKETIVEAARDIAIKGASHLEQQTGIKIEVPKGAPALSAEQRVAVLNVLNGANISVLEGIPGAGKTTAMREIVRQYKKAGKKVIGVAPSSSASLELARATGIDCRNGSLWRKTWLQEAGREFDLILRGDYYKEDVYKSPGSSSLTKDHVIIMDESSMVELANMDYFISRAKAVGAKIILVGDGNQLSPVGWAGALGRVISICGSQKLEESRRQQDPLHRQATKLLGRYRVREALDIFWKGDNIDVSRTTAEASSRCTEKFVSSYVAEARKLFADDLISIRSHAIGVFENKTRNLLNETVREQLKEAGVLKGREYQIWVGGVNGEKKTLKLMRGEQIVFGRNANRLGSRGVFNGEVGTVLKIRGLKQDRASGKNLAVIDILVHKANGKKEKVSLDLKDLSTVPWFEDGVSLEHGYALTAHKLQGASIDHMSVILEKGIGFEVFNVLATRHRESVSFYTNRKLLESAFYESLDEREDKARNRFDISEVKNKEGIVEEEVILKGGLAKLVSKRTNTSFASEYFSMGQMGEDKVIKEYLDKSEETIAAIRKITAWQAKTMRLTGKKPQMWDHEEFWQAFIEAREERAVISKVIEGDYGRFKERLMQLNMNFATIQKHASQAAGGKQLDKIIVEQKTTVLHEQEVFKELVESVFKGDTRAIVKNLENVNLHVAGNLAQIEEKNTAVKETVEERQELVDALVMEEHFREKLTPEYLSRIYKVSSKDRGQELEPDIGNIALAKYRELAQLHGAQRAASMVENKPTLLGNLKGLGLGRILAFTAKRADAAELCRNLGQQLRAYNKSEEMAKSYKEQLENEGFGAKIFKLEQEIAHLRALLPGDIDKEFLEQVEEKLGVKGAGQEVDWHDLQNSELFEVTRSLKYTKNRENIEKVTTELTPEPAAELVKSKIIARTASTGIIPKTSEIKADEVTARVEEVEQKVGTNIAQQSIALGGKANSAYIAETSPTEEITDNKIAAIGISQEKLTEAEGGKAQGVTEASASKSVTDKSVKASVSPEAVTAKKREAKPQLTYAQVKTALNQSVVSEIFYKYAPLINADGTIEKKGNRIFCGSLNMDLGNNPGLWNRFSDSRSKGDIFSFVEEATGYSKYEVLQIVASHAGIVPTASSAFKANSQVAPGEQHKQDINNEQQQPKDTPVKDEWVVVDMKNSKIDIPAFTPSKDLAFVSKNGGKIVDSYEYRNRDNELLGYAVRIKEGGDTGRKQVLPVAYCHNAAKDQLRWILKGFTDNGSKPIYGLEKVAANPGTHILIVEGEKTANSAQKLFKDHVVISWMGGAQGTDRVNWAQIAGMQVTIWPDNDKPGFEAAKNIKEHIDQHNGFTGLVSIVDTRELNLPQKWDLADKLPSHISKEQLAEIVKSASCNSKFNDRTNASKDERIIRGLEMLIASGKADKDEYISKEMYHESLLLIASNKGLKLNELTPENFADNIRDLQDEYRNLQGRVNLSMVGLLSSNNKGEQVLAEIVRDTRVLHQLQLGTKSLTITHAQHIEQTARKEIAQMKYFTESDKELLSRNMYQAITSPQWIEELKQKNQTLCAPIHLRFNAKSVEEFLDGHSNLGGKFNILESYKNLSNLRKYGIEEKGVLELFKTLPEKGIEHLEKLAKQLEEASGYLEHSKEAKEMLKEADEFGFKGADEKAKTRLIKDLTGKSSEERREHLYKIRDEHYVQARTKEIALAKTKAKTPQEAMKLLAQEQAFWLKIGDNVKSTNIIKTHEGIRSNIEEAKFNQQHKGVEELYKVAKYAFKNKIINEENLVKDLTSAKKITEIHDHITKNCYDHNCRILTKHCNEIAEGTTIEHEDHKFETVPEYLNHWKANVDHKLIPIKQITVELQKLHEKELTHDFGGPKL